MKRYKITIATALVVITTAVLAYVVIPSQSNMAVSTSTQTAKPANKEELLTLVNAERAKVGVEPLVLDERLNQSAQRKADDMAKFNYFEHISPNDGKHGYEYINDVGISCKTDGENISFAPSGTNTSNAVMDGWMNSKPHHDAILNPKYKVTGFGTNKAYVAEHFCEQ